MNISDNTAKEEGIRAYKDNKRIRDNPYSTNSLLQHISWMNGWFEQSCSYKEAISGERYEKRIWQAGIS